jgi:hypothetical protein
MRANPNKKNMPIPTLSRDDWKRKKQIKTVIWVTLAAVLFGCVAGGFILFAAYKK